MKPLPGQLSFDDVDLDAMASARAIERVPIARVDRIMERAWHHAKTGGCWSAHNHERLGLPENGNDEGLEHAACLARWRRLLAYRARLVTARKGL